MGRSFSSSVLNFRSDRLRSRTRKLVNQIRIDTSNRLYHSLVCSEETGPGVSYVPVGPPYSDGGKGRTEIMKTDFSYRWTLLGPGGSGVRTVQTVWWDRVNTTNVVMGPGLTSSVWAEEKCKYTLGKISQSDSCTQKENERRGKWGWDRDEIERYREELEPKGNPNLLSPDGNWTLGGEWTGRSDEDVCEKRKRPCVLEKRL